MRITVIRAFAIALNESMTVVTTALKVFTAVLTTVCVGLRVEGDRAGLRIQGDHLESSDGQGWDPWSIDSVRAPLCQTNNPRYPLFL